VTEDRAPARARRRAATPAAGDDAGEQAGTDDPQRTQALEPVDRPREGS
jgi:hypothetical protein